LLQSLQEKEHLLPRIVACAKSNISLFPSGTEFFLGGSLQESRPDCQGTLLHWYYWMHRKYKLDDNYTIYPWFYGHVHDLKNMSGWNKIDAFF